MNIFKIEGTFTSKPVLTVDGQSVPFETLGVTYLPKEVIGEMEYPEMVSLHFTLSQKVGNLEAKTYYRVKASKDGTLVLEDVGKYKRNSSETCEECGKTECECKEEEKAESFKVSLIKNVTK